MSEIFNTVVECITPIFIAPIALLIFAIVTFVAIRNAFQATFGNEQTENQESSEENTGDNESIRDQFITLMCEWEWGFKLMYKIGWARPGVDFFECGTDCNSCPKRDICTSEDMNLEVKHIKENRMEEPKPTRCIDPVIKYCQGCKWGWIHYPEWVETQEDLANCSCESGCTLGYDQGRPEDEPTVEELSEFDEYCNQLHKST